MIARCLPIISIGVLMLFLDSVRSQEQELRNLIRDGMRQARSSIQTFQAHIEIDLPQTPDGDEAQSGEPYWVDWWQDHETVRYHAKLRRKNRMDDRLWKNGVRKQLLGYVAPPRNPVYDAVLQQSDEFDEGLGLDNPWASAMYNCALFRSHPPTSVLLDEPYFVSLKSPVVSGRQSYIVQFNRGAAAPSGESCELWVDPRRNWLVVKLIVRQKAKSSAPETEIVREAMDIKQILPGIYFPGTVNSHIQKGTERKQQFAVRFSQVKINEPIEPSRFELNFPKGTYVADHIRGTVYATGGDEKPVGPEYPVPTPRLVDAPGTQFQTGDPRARGRWTKTLVFSAATATALLGLAAAWMALRRRRAASAAE